MKKETRVTARLALKKLSITALSQPESRQVKGGLTGNCPPPSAVRTIIGCVHPTTTVQHTFDC